LCENRGGGVPGPLKKKRKKKERGYSHGVLPASNHFLVQKKRRERKRERFVPTPIQKGRGRKRGGPKEEDEKKRKKRGRKRRMSKKAKTRGGRMKISLFLEKKMQASREAGERVPQILHEKKGERKKEAKNHPLRGKKGGEVFRTRTHRKGEKHDTQVQFFAKKGPLL